jgi:predicted amidohydrolase YtcJ
MNESQPSATAVAIDGNRVTAVGTDEEVSSLVGPETILVELDGRALLPGFVDAHSHYYGAASAEGQEPETTQARLLAAGITTVAELAVDEALLEEMRRLDEEGEIRVRSSAYLLADTACGDLTGDWQLAVPPTRQPGERFRIGGIKLFTDGGSCNAPAVSYEHSFGGEGDLYFSSGEIADLIRPFDEAGYQVAVHALGDRAVEATLDGLETVIGDSGNPLRHRIEHNAVVRPEMRDRYDEVEAVAVIFGALAHAPTSVGTIASDSALRSRTRSGSGRGVTCSTSTPKPCSRGTATSLSSPTRLRSRACRDSSPGAKPSTTALIASLSHITSNMPSRCTRHCGS